MFASLLICAHRKTIHEVKSKVKLTNYIEALGKLV